MPRPFSLIWRPLCVIGGTFIAMRLPAIVCTSTSPPSTASSTGTATSSIRSSPLRSKLECGRTFVTT